MESQNVTSSNKEVVSRFNREVIEQGNEQTFRDLMALDFINHSALPGTPTSPEGMWNTFHSVLRPALDDLTVTIHDQVAEGDLVTTRKTIQGIHTGPLMDIPATGKAVKIEVIDIVKLRDGQYAEHWGINNLPSVISQLRSGLSDT